MLQITLLGENIIADGDGTVLTQSSRSIALVAYLSAHAGAPQPRHQIAGLFWPDSTNAQALTNLRRELHQLRQTLGDDSSLLAGSANLCWQDSPGCRVDARVFDIERMKAGEAASDDDDMEVLNHGHLALEVFGGELLPGFDDDWARTLRSDLTRRCIELCDLIAAAGRRVGDLAASVDAMRRRIRLEPLAEAGYRTLMELQADLGDRAGAISTYHHCASVLERELGLDPDAQTREIFQRLLSDEGDTHPAITPAPSSVPHRTGAAAALLVGRERELQRILSIWREASSGHPQMLLVRGEPGVGKTRLLSEATKAARFEGATVAWAQCFGTSGQLPLAPVADWLREPVIAASRKRLSPVWRAEVERLVPDPGKRRSAGTSSHSLVDAWQRTLFFEGISRALIESRSPTLLMLDNLQWCDTETLSLIATCLRLTSDAPLLIAACVRDDALGHDPLAQWVNQVKSAGLLTEITLAPLDSADTTRLAEMLVARELSELDAQMLQETTGGFPLYIVETSRMPFGENDTAKGLGGTSAVLRLRLEQATPLARDIAGLAAAVGRDFSLGLIAEASDQPADDVVGSIDELWRLRIIRELPSGYDFSHDLLREAAYSQITPAARWLMHRRLAQAMEMINAEASGDFSAQLADQYARGGLLERAVSHYQETADIAAGTFATATAIKLYDTALETLNKLPESQSRDSTELGLVERLTPAIISEHGYSSPRVRQVVERWLTLAERLRRPDSVMASLSGLFASHMVQGQIAEAQKIAIRAIDMATPGSDLEGQAHFSLAASSQILGNSTLAVHQFKLAAEHAMGASSLIRPEILSLAWSAHSLWLLGSVEAATTAAKDAVLHAREANHPYGLAVALAYGALTMQLCGDNDQMHIMTSELRTLSDRFGIAGYREWGTALDGWREGGPAGIKEIQRGIDSLRSAQSLLRMPYWLSLAADLLHREGRHEAARATLDAALVEGWMGRDLWWLPEVMRARSVYDEPEVAEARLHRAHELASEHGSVMHLRAIEKELQRRGIADVAVRV